jgi:hypothetical protein
LNVGVSFIRKRLVRQTSTSYVKTNSGLGQYGIPCEDGFSNRRVFLELLLPRSGRELNLKLHAHEM